MAVGWYVRSLSEWSVDEAVKIASVDKVDEQLSAKTMVLSSVRCL